MHDQLNIKDLKTCKRAFENQGLMSEAFPDSKLKNLEKMRDQAMIKVLMHLIKLQQMTNLT